MHNPYQPSHEEPRVPTVTIRRGAWTLAGGVLGAVLAGVAAAAQPDAWSGWLRVLPVSPGLQIVLYGGLAGMLAGYTAACWLLAYNALQRVEQLRKDAQDDLLQRREQAAARARRSDQQPE